MAGEDVGSYAIEQGTLALSSNYTLTYVGADLTITQRAASVTPNSASKHYGESDPLLTGTLSGFLAADGVTATRAPGETVGTYLIAPLASARQLQHHLQYGQPPSPRSKGRSCSTRPSVAPCR